MAWENISNGVGHLMRLQASAMTPPPRLWPSPLIGIGQSDDATIAQVDISYACFALAVCISALLLLRCFWSTLLPSQAPVKDRVAPSKERSGPLPLGVRDNNVLLIPPEDAQSWEDEVRKKYSSNLEDSSQVDNRLQSLLVELRSKVQCDTSESWKLHEPLDDVFFTRCLMCTGFDRARARQTAERYVAWRHTIGGAVSPSPDWISMGIVIVPFEDRLGRPVVILRAKYIDTAKLTPELLAQGYRASIDAVIAHLLRKRTQHVCKKNPLETFLLVIDAEGAGFRNFAPGFLKIMAKESGEHYPDRLAGVVALGCGRGARMVWDKMISPMVAPRTRNMVQLVTLGETVAVMQSLVEPEHLPARYGGTAPAWAVPGEVASLEARVGAIAAAAYSQCPGLEAYPAMDKPSKPVGIRQASKTAVDYTLKQAAAAGASVCTIVADKKVQTTAAGAAGGAIVVGTGGATTGFVAGGVTGAAVGVPFALFTFGLSIPFCAAVGSGMGTVSGAAVGSSVGFVGGGAVGYGVGRRREQLNKDDTEHKTK